MPLDFEKLKDATLYELAALAICEFSRFVDAIERIAPELGAVDEPVTDTAPPCPHPLESRVDQTSMGHEKGYEFICAACQAHIRGGVVVE